MLQTRCSTIIANKKWYLISLAWMLRVLSLLDLLRIELLNIYFIQFCFILFCISTTLLLFNIKLHPRADVLLFLIFAILYFPVVCSVCLCLSVYILTFIPIFIFHYTNSFLCIHCIYNNLIKYIFIFLALLLAAFKKSWVVTYFRLNYYIRSFCWKILASI